MWSDRDPIAVELRAERMRQGLTLQEVAHLMGWATSAPLYRLEKGTCKPTLGTLRRWSRVLGREVGLLPVERR
jgi:transcriptional regulator with XRE-family HTH domain